jgi:hypothetical protein
MDNELRKLLDELNEAFRNLAKAACEANYNYAQYQRAWLEAGRFWEIAMSQIVNIVKMMGLTTYICDFPDDSTKSIWLEHWHGSPPPPIQFYDFLRRFAVGVANLTQKLYMSNTACKEATNVLHELAKALAPEAAMQKLAEGGGSECFSCQTSSKPHG